MSSTDQVTTLHAEMSRVIESHLDDWDSESSFRKQLSSLVNHLFETIAETCPARLVPADAVCMVKDGDMWCCVHTDFINLQESPAGFGKTMEEAHSNLLSQ